MKITLLGPCWPYRGGIAAFSERLAQQLVAEGHEVKLYTFTLQYPGFLFPGTTQYSESPAPEGLDIERQLSSVNPISWIKLGRRIGQERPDLLILAYWMPFMAPCLGTVARVAKVKSVALCHNLMPHELRPGDKWLTRWFLGSVQGLAALSQSVCDDAHKFSPQMPTVASPHPLYDNFGEAVSRDEACQKLGLDAGKRYFLFFGLIRDYKGLDWLLEAMAKFWNAGNADYELIVAGEFYSHKEKYLQLAQDLGIDHRIKWHTRFVPDEEVRYYFSAADLVVQPYKSATQSGVTQIAYQFAKPMLVTRVGGLAEIVPDGEVGYAVEPNAEAIAEALQRFATEKPDFAPGIEKERSRYSWANMAKAILSLQ